MILEGHLTDPMALVAGTPQIGVSTDNPKQIMEKTRSYQYWATAIIPLASREHQIEKYDVEGLKGEEAYRKIKELLSSGSQVTLKDLNVDPVTRWAIIRNFMKDVGRHVTIDSDYSLSRLNDLRLLNRFSKNLVYRLNELRSLDQDKDEPERLKIFSECVTKITNELLVERGEPKNMPIPKKA